MDMKSVSSRLLVAAAMAGLCFGLVSCGMLSQSARAIGHKMKGGDDKMNGRYDINEGTQGSRGGLDALGSMNRDKSMATLPREEDIVWAPENPDMPIIGLEGIANSDADAPVDAWYVDYKKALQQSRQEGKPLMIWFTSTRNSPFCKALSNELFSKPEFDTWARENVVRLRIDSHINGKTDSERVEKRKYVEALKKRYKIMGHPVTLMLSPRGTQFGQYRGYKSGDADFYWGRIKNAVRSANQDYVSWKSEMEKKGYRVWHSATGKTVFAKVARYSKGRIWLIEPDGRKTSTTVSRLALEDKLYIDRKIEESRSKNR